MSLPSPEYTDAQPRDLSDAEEDDAPETVDDDDAPETVDEPEEEAQPRGTEEQDLATESKRLLQELALILGQEGGIEKKKRLLCGLSELVAEANGTQPPSKQQKKQHEV